MKAVKKRLFELFVTSIVISVIIVALFILQIIPSSEFSAAITCIIGTGVFVEINIKQLQRCMVDMASLKKYYKYNYIAYGIYALVSSAICLFAPVELFSIAFSFTKFVRYSYEVISYRKSLLIFHAIMIIVIALAPLILPERYKLRIQKRKYARKMKKKTQNNKEAATK